MAAAPNRCTVTINGTKFDAACANIKFKSQTDSSGQPLMGSLNSEMRVFADFHDTNNLPFSALQSFFNLANVVVKQNIVSMQIDIWQDESKSDALCSFKFNGWISRFETINPSNLTANIDFGNSNLEDGSQQQGVTPLLNHMLILDLQPAMNQSNFSSVSLSN